MFFKFEVVCGSNYCKTIRATLPQRLPTKREKM